MKDESYIAVVERQVFQAGLPYSGGFSFISASCHRQTMATTVLREYNLCKVEDLPENEWVYCHLFVPDILRNRGDLSWMSINMLIISTLNFKCRYTRHGFLWNSHFGLHVIANLLSASKMTRGFLAMGSVCLVVPQTLRMAQKTCYLW